MGVIGHAGMSTLEEVEEGGPLAACEAAINASDELNDHDYLHRCNKNRRICHSAATSPPQKTA
jgi:hypothetical protein